MIKKIILYGLAIIFFPIILLFGFITYAIRELRGEEWL